MKEPPNGYRIALVRDSSQPKIGISTLVDYTYPLESLLPRIRQAGFDAVAFGHKATHFTYFEKKRISEVADLCERLGLFVDYIHTPIDIFLDLTSPNEHARQATIATYKFAVDAAKEMGGRAVTVHVCNKELMTEDEMDARVPFGLDSFKTLGEYSAEKGILFCVENLPFTQSYHRMLVKLLKAYESNHIYLCLDTCHISMGNPEPFSFIEAYAPLIKNLHLSDNFGQRDLHLIPYTGSFDFDRLARLLGQTGYDGNVMLENSREAAARRIDRGRSSSREPELNEIDDYLVKSFLAAKRFQLELMGARQQRKLHVV